MTKDYEKENRLLKKQIIELKVNNDKLVNKLIEMDKKYNNRGYDDEEDLIDTGIKKGLWNPNFGWIGW